jgi:hypothetical protein
LRKFCWACESFGAEPDLDTFCEYYKLQRQPKRWVMMSLLLSTAAARSWRRGSRGILGWKFCIARRIGGIRIGCVICFMCSLQCYLYP